MRGGEIAGGGVELCERGVWWCCVSCAALGVVG